MFLFAGFLVSIEVFREIRIPFTSIAFARDRHESRGRRRRPLAESSTTDGPPSRPPSALGAG